MTPEYLPAGGLSWAMRPDDGNVGRNSGRASRAGGLGGASFQPAIGRVPLGRRVPLRRTLRRSVRQAGSLRPIGNRPSSARLAPESAQAPYPAARQAGGSRCQTPAGDRSLRVWSMVAILFLAIGLFGQNVRQN